MYHQEGPPDSKRTLLDRPRGLGSIWIIIEKGDGPGNPDRPLSLLAVERITGVSVRLHPSQRRRLIWDHFAGLRQSVTKRPACPALHVTASSFDLAASSWNSLTLSNGLELAVAHDLGDHVALLDAASRRLSCLPSPKSRAVPCGIGRNAQRLGQLGGRAAGPPGRSRRSSPCCRRLSSAGFGESRSTSKTTLSDASRHDLRGLLLAVAQVHDVVRLRDFAGRDLEPERRRVADLRRRRSR